MKRRIAVSGRIVTGSIAKGDQDDGDQDDCDVAPEELRPIKDLEHLMVLSTNAVNSAKGLLK